MGAKTKRWQKLLGQVTYLLYAIGLTAAFRWWTLTTKSRRALANLINAGPWPFPWPPERLWASNATPHQMAVVNERAHPIEVRTCRAPIYMAELLALWRATVAAPPHTCICVDNQAVIGSLRRTKVDRIMILLASYNKAAKDLQVIYIPSRCNPADFFTRHPAKAGASSQSAELDEQDHHNDVSYCITIG